MAGSVDRSADVLALRALVQQYARGADTRDAARFVDAFTDDGRLVTSRGEILDHDVLVTLAPALARYRATMHLVGDHDVVFDGDDLAHGTTACQASHVYAADGIDRVHVMQIVYHDRYVREPRGWRIAERRLDVVWTEDRPLRSPGTS
jgi:uncharacterized protein (TIGR02246 family)